VHSLGYRYRLHRPDLPGRPDLVFPGRRKVIFVHGCFWHRHEGCSAARIPKSRRAFWKTKLEANRERDRRVIRRLRGLGWGVMIVWECSVGNSPRLAKRIERFLG
jgi:DNA mismatch endonuclease (patch repair protein)